MTTAGGSIFTASTHFAFRLLQRAAKQSRGGNVVLSPIGVFQALSIFAFLSPVPFRRELRKELRLAIHSDADQSLFDSYCSLVSLRSDRGDSGALDVATSFWTGDHVRPNPNLEMLAKNWGIELFAGDHVSSENIEGWATQAIPGLVSAELPLPSPDGAIAMNAASIQPAWQTPFRLADSVVKPFVQAAGPPKLTPLMRNPSATNVEIFHSPKFDAARIPLASGNGGRSLHVVLPRRTTMPSAGSGNHITPFVEQFTVDEWGQCKSGYRPARLDLMLPRLYIEQQYDLYKTLLAMGFGRAFDSAGRVPPFAPALDRSIVQIAMRFEEGVDAPDPSKLSAPMPSLRRYQPPPLTVERFHLDRPFVFFITADSNDLILFAGVVHES